MVLQKALHPCETFVETAGTNVIAGLGSSKLTSEIAGLDPSSSIIDRLFGDALTLNGDHPSHPSEVLH